MTDQNDCENLSPDSSCILWAKKGYCTQTYQGYMSLNCRKSCGLCGSGESCNDESLIWVLASECWLQNCSLKNIHLLVFSIFVNLNCFHKVNLKVNNSY